MKKILILMVVFAGCSNPTQYPYELTTVDGETTITVDCEKAEPYVNPDPVWPDYLENM